MLVVVLLSVVRPSVVTLGVAFSYCSAECHQAESRSTECHYAECLYVVYHYAECRYTECPYTECHYAACHFAESHGTVGAMASAPTTKSLTMTFPTLLISS